MTDTTAGFRPADHAEPHFWREVLDHVVEALSTLGEGYEKYRHFEALNALDDTELARRGLKRGDLARHVFVRSTWT